MAGISKKVREKQKAGTCTIEDICNTPGRWIIWEHVKNSLSLKEAAKQAHLSHKYVKNWVAKNGLYALAIKEIKENTEDLRGKALQKLWKIASEPTSNAQTVIKALDLIGKMCGWHSTTTILETGARQAELDESRRDAARRLAMISYNYLPAPRIEDITGDKQAESVMPEYGSGGDRLPYAMPEGGPGPDSAGLTAIDAVIESEGGNVDGPG